MNNIISKFITVRNEFEGFHHYPDAGSIDPRIKFLENEHRHMFKVKTTISVTHSDRELEFFLVKWFIQGLLKDGQMNNKSCEMIAEQILVALIDQYGSNRRYVVTVSEDGESDGTVVYEPCGQV